MPWPHCCHGRLEYQGAPGMRMGRCWLTSATWTALSWAELFSHIKTSTSWHDTHQMAEIRTRLLAWWLMTCRNVRCLASQWRGEWMFVVTTTLWQLSSSLSWEVQNAGWQHRGTLTPRSYATPMWRMPLFCRWRTDSRHCKTLKRRL